MLRLAAKLQVHLHHRAHRAAADEVSPRLHPAGEPRVFTNNPGGCKSAPPVGQAERCTLERLPGDIAIQPGERRNAEDFHYPSRFHLQQRRKASVARRAG